MRRRVRSEKARNIRSTKSLDEADFIRIDKYRLRVTVSSTDSLAGRPSRYLPVSDETAMPYIRDAANRGQKRRRKAKAA
jgi:hypothetical protein